MEGQDEKGDLCGYCEEAYSSMMVEVVMLVLTLLLLSS
jgi:hypothetical protein